MTRLSNHSMKPTLSAIKRIELEARRIGDVVRTIVFAKRLLELLKQVKAIDILFQADYRY